MNCPETTRLLNPYVDGELDLATALAIEEHTQRCARCRVSLESLVATRAAIARHCEFKAAPESLESRLRARVARETASGWRAALGSPLAVAAPGLAALALAGWLALSGPVTPGESSAAGTTRVVYHLSGNNTAGTALRNLANHLEAEPAARIVVVAHNDGVDFLLRGARDAAGEAFEPAVNRLLARGVVFRACNNTLERRRIDVSQLIPAAALVPSGIAEIGRLQSQEGYAYLRL